MTETITWRSVADIAEMCDLHDCGARAEQRWLWCLLSYIHTFLWLSNCPFTSQSVVSQFERWCRMLMFDNNVQCFSIFSSHNFFIHLKSRNLKRRNLRGVCFFPYMQLNLTAAHPSATGWKELGKHLPKHFAKATGLIKMSIYFIDSLYIAIRETEEQGPISSVYTAGEFMAT